MDKKKEKKGFWVSLFAPKPCKCSCRGFTIKDFPCLTWHQLTMLSTW